MTGVSAGVLEGYGFEHIFTTRWNDNDVFGHLNNTIYYAAMDTTITSWLLSREEFQLNSSTGIAVVVSSSCTYLESVAFPESLVIGLRAAKLGSSSVTWELGIHRSSDRKLIAHGQFVHVFLDEATKRPTPIPALLRASIEAHLVTDRPKDPGMK